MQRSDVAKAVVVAAEVMGHELSPVAAKAMARELAAYEPGEVSHALRRCTRELSGKLTLAAIFERLPGAHVSADEAWAVCPRGEDDTAVWTDEISGSWAAAKPLLDAGDDIAARMAFRDAYRRAVAESGAAGQRAKWWVSPGRNAAQRAAKIHTAVEQGRLAQGFAAKLLAPGDERAASQVPQLPPMRAEEIRALTAGLFKVPQ